MGKNSRENDGTITINTSIEYIFKAIGRTITGFKKTISDTAKKIGLEVFFLH